MRQWLLQLPCSTKQEFQLLKGDLERAYENAIRCAAKNRPKANRDLLTLSYSFAMFVKQDAEDEKKVFRILSGALRGLDAPAYYPAKSEELMKRMMTELESLAKSIGYYHPSLLQPWTY